MSEADDLSRSVFRSISDGLIVVDQSGIVADINAPAVYALDIAASKVLGKHFFGNLNVPELENQVTDFFAEPDVYAVKRFSITMSDRAFMVTLDPIFSDSHERLGVLLVLHDITEERKLLSAKDEFIWAASHELYTPLTEMRWNLEFLAAIPSLKGEERQAVEDLTTGFFRILTLAKDILDVAEVETGRSVFKIEPFELDETANAAIANVRSKFAEKKIKLVTEIKKVKARGDKKKALAVISELLENAVKFTDKGEIIVRVYGGEAAVVDVTDSGIGIENKKRKELFTKFGRLGSAMDNHRGGTGLRLYKVKLYSEGMGAKAKLKSSALGKGSTFSIEFIK